MNKLTKYNKKIILSTVALALAAAAFVASICYAWFMAAMESRTGSTTTKVVGGAGIEFGDITAVKYYVPAKPVENVDIEYKDSGKYKRTSCYTVSENGIVTYASGASESYDGKNEDNIGVNPIFAGLGTGDYVDITFSFHITDQSLKDQNYEVVLSDFATDKGVSAGTKNSSRKYSFQLTKNESFYTDDTKEAFFDSTIYGSLGVFRWGIVETTNGEDTTKMKYFHSEYKSTSEDKTGNVFDYYSDGHSDSNYYVTIKEGTFAGVGEKTTFTLRIMVDTDDFIKLIESKGADTYDYSDDNGEYYLNGIMLSIGTITITKASEETVNE